jgi:hypothetical protein
MHQLGGRGFHLYWERNVAADCDQVHAERAGRAYRDERLVQYLQVIEMDVGIAGLDYPADRFRVAVNYQPLKGLVFPFSNVASVIQGWKFTQAALHLILKASRL